MGHNPIVDAGGAAALRNRIQPRAPAGPRRICRCIKDSPPYLHDGWLLTLADTVEFFNLILETHLTADEKTELEAFLRVL